jgi:hypothetical protein
MAKVLYGLIGDKIAVVDADTSVKAKKQCFREKCTSVIVAEKTDELMVALTEGHSVLWICLRVLSYEYKRFQ